MSETNAALITRAQGLKAVIHARSQAMEAARKPNDATMQDLVDAGIMQMLVPAKWGGAESDLMTMFQVVEEISSACISTGWVTSFYINHNVYAAKFSPALQQKIFGGRGFTLMPGATAPTMKATRVDGGWQVNGRASWGSGVMHADWIFVSGMTEDGLKGFAIPIEDVEVDDVWHFAGMAGTGSNDMVIKDIFVPDDHIINGMDFRAGPTEGSRDYANPLYSMPQLPLAYCTVIGVLTGGLKGAMQAYQDMVDKRVRNFSGTVVKDQQHTHVTLGELHIATQMAHDLGRLLVEKVEAIVASRPFTTDDRVNVKAQLAFVSKLCRDTINQMMAYAGASSFHLDQPLQRYWRDLNTVCSHAFWDWDVAREQMGRLHLGLEPNHPLV